jgi:hypothetical protein
VRFISIIVAAVLLLALPSLAVAQGGYGPSGGVLGEENAGGGAPTTTNNGNGGGGSQGGDTAPASVESGANVSGGGSLPFTGADLLVVAAIGMALVGAGVGLRRLRDNP